jgi:hypothetical protein
MASSTVNSAPVASSHSGNASVQNSSSRPTLRTSTNKSSDGGQRYVSLAFPLRLNSPFSMSGCYSLLHSGGHSLNASFCAISTICICHVFVVAEVIIRPIILSYIQTATLLLFSYYRTIPLTTAIFQAQQFSEGLDSRDKSDYPTPFLSPAERQHTPEDVVAHVHEGIEHPG